MEVIKTIEGPVALTSVAISITTGVYFYRQIEDLKKRMDEMSRILSVTIEKLTEHNNQIDNLPIIINNLREINKDRLNTQKTIKKLNNEIAIYRKLIDDERMKINEIVYKIDQLTGEETEILPKLSKKLMKKLTKNIDSDSDDEPKKKTKKSKAKKKRVHFQKIESDEESSESSTSGESSDDLDELCREISD